MFGRGRGRIRWFKKVLVVILCYLSNIKLQMDRMSAETILQGRDQDQKLRNNLLYSSMIGVGGVFKSYLRRFKTILVVILRVSMGFLIRSL